MNIAGTPGAWAQAFYHVPVALYQLGLGGFERLLGMQFLMLTTRGRRSGLPRIVMLDLVGEDGDTYFAQSGWSDRTAWVKNLRANPEVVVQVGRQRHRAQAAELPAPEGADRLVTWFREHPIYTRTMFTLLGVSLPFGDEAALRTHCEANALVFAFRRLGPASDVSWAA